ncbi:MAG: DUF4253 domain-containing protein [Solirubrobacteraceae bacterium]
MGILPANLPAPVPQNFAAGLRASAFRDCEQLAVRFGYGRAGDLNGTGVTGSQSIRLIGTLTAHTPIRVPGVPVPKKYEVGIPLGADQAAPGTPSIPTVATPMTPPPISTPPASYTASHPGKLPRRGRPVVDGIQLPVGQRAAGRVPMWETTRPTPDAILLASRLAIAFPHTGLWPVLWGFSDEPASYMDNHGDVSAIGRQPVAQVFSRLWRDARHGYGDRRPFQRPFAGVAPPAPHRLPSNPFALFYANRRHMVYDDLGPYRLLLIPCRRPADAVTAVNFQLITSVRLADISSVLRSWEHRFGAHLVLMGSSVVILSVQSPPRDAHDADLLGNELLAMSPPENAAGPRNELILALTGHASATSGEYPPSDFTPGTWAIGWNQ